LNISNIGGTLSNVLIFQDSELLTIRRIENDVKVESEILALQQPIQVHERPKIRNNISMTSMEGMGFEPVTCIHWFVQFILKKQIETKIEEL